VKLGGISDKKGERGGVQKKALAKALHMGNFSANLKDFPMG
jgi:hypothetical protein